MSDKRFSRCLAVILWLNALWPMVIAAGAATEGDYGGLAIMPCFSAFGVAIGIYAWRNP